MNTTVLPTPASPAHGEQRISAGPHVLRGDARTIVWLHGDQDLATEPALALVLSGEVMTGHADIVVDLRDVTFIDASILATLVGTRDRLHDGDRSLSVRSSPPCASRLFEVCGLTDLVQTDTVDPPLEPTASGPSHAA